jgi:hypothetical protein
MLRGQKTEITQIGHKGIGFPTQEELDLRACQSVSMEDHTSTNAKRMG